MADSRSKSTADGKRPMAASGVKRCDVCHGPLKLPVNQLGASRRPECSSQRRVVCSDCGQCRSAADLAEDAVNVVSRHLGYFMVPCPYAEYGCASSVVSRDAAAHAAACRECAFLGSPAQLVRHLTARPHDLTATKFTYGNFFPFVVNMLEEPRRDKHLLVAEEDGGVFLLALGGHGKDPHFGRAAVVCVRGNADAGPAYSSYLTVECKPRVEYISRTLVVPSYSTSGEFDVDAPCFAVCPFSLHGEETKELHLSIRIDREEAEKIYVSFRIDRLREIFGAQEEHQ